MDIFDRAPHFTFRTKTLGDEFCKRLRDLAYKVDVVTVNDILRDRGEGIIPEGFQYGYSKKEIRKLKPVKVEDNWQVYFPMPGMMIRDIHGYWTTEAVETLESLDSGGDG